MLALRTNTIAQRTNTALHASDSALQSAIERLSSGLRVNTAKDDAAGMAISNRLSVQVKGKHQAARNANDGISLVQTAGSALGDINRALQRIRELSVQGLNGTLDDRDTDAIQSEINANLREIDRIVAQTHFNGFPMLDGRAPRVDLQVGAYDGERLSADFGTEGFGVKALGLEDFTIAGIDGTITPVSRMTGSAFDIELASPSTAVNYGVPAGVSNPKLVMSSNGMRYVQGTDASGNAVFHAAGVNATHDTATRASTVTVTTGGTLYTGVATLGGGGTTVSLRDDAGQPYADGLTRDLVQADGRYWIRTQDGMGAGLDGYVEADLAYAAGSSTMTATARNAPMIDGTTFSATPVAVVTQPAVDVSTAGMTFLDNGGNAVSGARLVRSGGAYIMEVGDGAGGFQYYNATVDVSVDTDGNAQATVRQTGAAPRTFSDVTTVSGTSLVTIDPSNVSVNYTDREGRTYNGVLRDGGAGVYHFDLSDSGDAYKTATVVQNEDGEYLLKTTNGSNELLLYYRLTYSAVTDVNDDSTVMTFTEASDAIRLRQPRDPLAALDRAIAKVDAMRGELGALHNRLESVVNSLTTGANDIAMARSRIMDADYAVEASNMVRSQILQQAATSVLAQANQAPQRVLSLLQ